MIDEWPKIDPFLQQPLGDLIDILDSLEDKYPHVFSAVENFVEQLMNYFPVGSDGVFRVNPHPIASVTVIPEPTKKVQ